jgi:hypothetical protein
MPFAENLGSGGSALDAQYGSSSAPNTNSPLLLDPRTSGNFLYTPGSAGNYVSVPHADSLNILGTEGTKFLSLPGTIGNYASTSDAPTLDILGDLEIVSRVRLQTFGGNPYLISKNGFTTQGGYSLRVEAGALRLIWSDGVATRSGTAGQTLAAAGLLPGVTYWLKATLDADVSGTNHQVQLYWAADSPTEPVSWTAFTPPAAGAGTTFITANTSSMAVGAFVGGIADVVDGNIYRAIVRNGIAGTTVFDADFTQQTIGSRGFIESTGKLVTLTGAAAQIVDGTTYGFLPGVAGAGWSTPDTGSTLDVSDLMLTARVSLNVWNTGAFNQTIMAKYDNGSAQKNFIWYMSAGRQVVQYDVGGVLQPLLDWGTNPSPYPFTAGGTYWLRVRRIAATGVWRFDYAPDSEVEPAEASPAWVNVGGDRAGTAGTINDSTALLTIGGFNNGVTGYMAAGRVFRAIVRNANTGGTKVFDADFTRQIQFAGSFTEATGKVVTTQGAARIERARDLEIVTRVAMDDWQSGGSIETLLCKDDLIARTYRAYMNNGNVVLGWYPIGTSTGSLAATSTAAITAADGDAMWLKITLAVSSGANYVVSFYTATDSPTEPTVWTPLGSTVPVAGSTSLGPSVAPVTVGIVGTLLPLAGKTFRSIIRNGINGPAVLDLDFTQQITTGSQSVIEPASGATIPQAVQYAPNLGTGGAALNARYGSTTGADTNDPLLLEHTGENYLYLPGVASNYASAPDADALDITGDIDIRVRCTLDALGTFHAFACKGQSSDRSFDFYQNSSNQPVLRWTPDGTFASLITVTGSAAFSAAAGVSLWRRVTLDVDNGSGQYEVKFWEAPDSDVMPTSWSQVGTTTTGGSTTSIFASGQPMGVGGGVALNVYSQGKFYRAQIRNGIGGTVVFDADFTTGITSGGQTSFTESSSNAATVTINRSSSGRKSVAVVRPVWLFGTDDYLEVADNDLLDFGASDSFTVVAVVRRWTNAANNMIMAKRDGATGNGYHIQGNASDWQLSLYDGSVSAAPTVATTTSGALSSVAGVVNRSTQTAVVYANATSGSSTSTSTLGSLATSQPLNVGRRNTIYGDFELLGVAIFRRALTASEIALVNTHYQSGPTAASNALLSESVWWIDAGRTAAAQINRSTTGRKSVACADCVWLLGTDDFFEVADNPLLDFDQGEDFTLLSLVRVWDFQGTNDTLMAKSSSTTTAAAGYGIASGATNPLTTTARLGDGSTGASVSTLARVPSRLVAVWAWRDTATGLLHVALNNDAGSSTADLTTGNSANSLALRLGALSGVASEFLDAELKSTAIWRRKLTAAERAAVNTYYGTV